MMQTRLWALGSDTAGQDDVLTVGEVARFLRVPQSTIYKLTRLEQLPAVKVGKHLRFTRRDIAAWVHGPRT
jgi:excisionase family DNA binding protein